MNLKEDCTGTDKIWIEIQEDPIETDDKREIC